MTAANGSEFKRYQERVRGTNISEQTLLATDYLNHFNEIVMLLEMLADIPECFEDAKAWAPKSYPDHFLESGFSDKDLAVEAYEHVPPCYRQPFDNAVAAMNSLVLKSLEQIEGSLERGDDHATRLAIASASGGLHKLIEVASAIIHGHEATLEQDEIDTLLNG
jgi:hypothetical protein